jgi:hypothetical protein
MNRSNVGRRVALVSAAAALALPLAGSTATASGGDGGQVNGCYANATGALRVIDPGSKNPLLKRCQRGETPISWSQVGRPGSTGPAGPAGPPGAQGPAGEPGPEGPGLRFDRFANFSYELGPQTVIQDEQLDCPTGTVALSLGHSLGGGVTLTGSLQVDVDTWSFSARTEGLGGWAVLRLACFQTPASG